MTVHEFEAQKDNKTPITPGLSAFDGTLAGRLDSSTVAWRIPWTEEPGATSVGSQRVGHD